MKKCLLWGTGLIFGQYYNTLQYYKWQNKIEIIGITSSEPYYTHIMGIPFIQTKDIDLSTFDRLIVMADSDSLRAISQKASILCISDSNIVPVKAMSIPGFDFDKYKAIRENVPSIIAPNCWAGLLYNKLGLEFKTPFINMFIGHEDYLKLLKDFNRYMNASLELVKYGYNRELNINYPIVKCADILLYFNHYHSFKEVEACWNRRKKRLNSKNMIVMFYDENIPDIDDFLHLEYEKKICFVPFSFKDESVFSMADINYTPDTPFWKIVNRGAAGYYYDLFELLLSNRFVRFTDFV